MMAFLLSLICLSAAGARAQGMSTVLTPELQRTARQLALGDGAAHVEGLNALGINPAALTVPRGEILAQFQYLSQETAVGMIGAAYPLNAFDAKETLAVSLLEMRSSGFDRRDSFGKASGNFSIVDRLIGVYVSRPFQFDGDGPALDLGIGYKLLLSRIDSYGASAHAADAGARLSFKSLPLTLGVSVRNLGKGPAYIDQESRLPTSYLFSVAYRAGTPLTVTASANRRVRTRANEFSLGFEAWSDAPLTLRAHYSFVADGAEGAGLENLAGGVGLNLGQGLSLDYGFQPFAGPLRAAGAGRKKITARDPRLTSALERLIEPDTRGDPETPLRWTCKSTRTLAAQLTRRRHPISHMKVAQLLHAQGYSLQGNRKTEEGADHPDRDAQFHHINKQVKRILAKGAPVISVDTKKKELVGNYANAGRQWRPKKNPAKVQGHDFPDPEVPRAYPYGVYDIDRNRGFVSVGIDHDTSAFAVASIRGWWRHEGRRLYPGAKDVLITADAGGSNGRRRRLWKLELQTLADETGLFITVCHFPPGTSKWNKIEHRLFSFISSNWRGEPLRDYETIVKLISRTVTAKGLKVTCRLDRRKYPIGRKVTDEEMLLLNLQRHKRFHGEWNYTIRPRTKL